MTDPLRVVVADDHLLVREGVRSLLEVGGDVRVVAAVGSAGALLDAVDATLPDAVLTDIRMPPGQGLDGIVAAREIRRRHPRAGVVVLSQHLEDLYVRELFAEGSAGLGYLLKHRVANRAELVSALNNTTAGGSVLDPLVVDRLLASRDATDSPVASLSPREREVLALMATGLSNSSIAARVHLSLSSVEKHVSSIFTTLGLVAEPSTDRRVMAVLTYLQDG